MKKSVLFAFAFILWSLPAGATVVTEAVEYKHGDAVLEGFLAYDDATQAKRPGVLVVHEWKGLNDYAKKRALMLAEMGYVAFAVDMYGKGITAKDHAEAGKLAGIYKSDRNLMRARAKAGLEVLKSHPLVDPEKTAAIGYCFGGTTVLELARAGEPLLLVASFHGSLDTPVPAKVGEIRAKVAVFHGAEDSFISHDDIHAFKDEMRTAGADWTFVGLGGAVHSFTVPEAGDDPSKGMAYNALADRRSWAMLKNFFDELFRSV